MNDSLQSAARIIRDCGLVIYPTETVYGIGADALNESAVRKVFAIKKRSLQLPLSLAIASYEMLDRVAICVMDLVRKLLPGPITVILPKKPIVPDILTAGSDRVGIRYPDHDLTLKLIDLAETPITSTSANLTGDPEAREVALIDERVVCGVDHLIDRGRCRYGVASTVVDLADRRILRRGAGYERVIRALRL